MFEKERKEKNVLLSQTYKEDRHFSVQSFWRNAI